MKKIFASCIFALTSATIFATTFRVSPLGSDSTSTLSSALGQAVAGDTIELADGIYSSFSVPADLAITIEGSANAIIDGGGVSRCVTLNSATLIGVTLRNGFSDNGGGVFGGKLQSVSIDNCTARYRGGAAYQSSLQNCKLMNNTAEMGGAVAESTVERSTFSGNRADFGGAAYQSTVSASEMRENVATSFGSAVYGGTVFSTLVVNNSTEGGAATIAFANAYNITLASNSSEQDVAGIALASKVVNTLYWENSVSNRIANAVTEATLPISRFGVAESNSLVNQNVFKDAQHQNYRISQTTSAVFDKGDDTVAEWGRVDAAGHQRVQGAHIDIGAYEAPTGEKFTLNIQVQGHGSVEPVSVEVTPGDAITLTAVADTSAPRTFLGFYVNGSLLSRESVYTFEPQEGDKIVAHYDGIYVDAANGSDDNNGLTSSSAFATLSAATASAREGEIISLANGNYALTGLSTPIILQARGDLLSTVLTGNGSFAGSTIVGCTISPTGNISGGVFHRCVISQNTHALQAEFTSSLLKQCTGVIATAKNCTLINCSTPTVKNQCVTQTETFAETTYYTLASTSSAIDAGTLPVDFYDNLDLRGRNRVLGASIDFGAVESNIATVSVARQGFGKIFVNGVEQTATSQTYTVLLGDQIILNAESDTVYPRTFAKYSYGSTERTDPTLRLVVEADTSVIATFNGLSVTSNSELTTAKTAAQAGETVTLQPLPNGETYNLSSGFASNISIKGGSSNPADVQVTGNVASGNYEGLTFVNSTLSNLTLNRCFVKNSSGTLTSVTASNTIIASNTVAKLISGGTFTNCTVLDNTVTTAANSATLTNTIIEGTVSGGTRTNCLTSRPTFEAGTYKLAGNASTAINGGKTVSVGELDFYGNKRITAQIIDIGASEWPAPPYNITIVRNGFGDVSPAAGTYQVDRGATFEITVTENAQYRRNLISVTIDGTQISLTNGKYSWIPVADSTVIATYENLTATPATLDEVLADARDGETILLEEGIYSPIKFSGKALKIFAKALNPALTVIDGGGIVRAVTLTDGSILRGVTVRNGRDNMGAGVMGGTVERCIIRDNTLTYNGLGAGVYGSVVYNSLLIRNGSTSIARASGGGAAYSTLYNCTVANNVATRGGGVYECTVCNTIISKNSDLSGSDSNWYGESVPEPESCCSTEVESETCISADPQFVDAENDDYRLRETSPCRDVGNADCVQSEIDLVGANRIYNSVVDMGALEWDNPPYEVTVKIKGYGKAVVNGTTVEYGNVMTVSVPRNTPITLAAVPYAAPNNRLLKNIISEGKIISSPWTPISANTIDAEVIFEFDDLTVGFENSTHTSLTAALASVKKDERINVKGSHSAMMFTVPAGVAITGSDAVISGSMTLLDGASISNATLINGESIIGGTLQYCAISNMTSYAVRNATLVNCLVKSNAAGVSNSVAYASTILSNRGVGATDSTLNSTLIWDNETNFGGNISASYCCSDSLLSGVGNVATTAPLLDANDCPTRYSACVNAGAIDTADWLTQNLDLNSKLRIQLNRLDIGCYEYEPKSTEFMVDNLQLCETFENTENRLENSGSLGNLVTAEALDEISYSTLMRPNGSVGSTASAGRLTFTLPGNENAIPVKNSTISYIGKFGNNAWKNALGIVLTNATSSIVIRLEPASSTAVYAYVTKNGTSCTDLFTDSVTPAFSIPSWTDMQHIVISVQNGILHLYVNGVLTTSSIKVFAEEYADLTIQKISLGHAMDSSRIAGNSRADDLRVFNTGFSVSQVAELYKNLCSVATTDTSSLTWYGSLASSDNEWSTAVSSWMRGDYGALVRFDDNSDALFADRTGFNSARVHVTEPITANAITFENSQTDYTVEGSAKVTATTVSKSTAGSTVWSAPLQVANAISVAKGTLALKNSAVAAASLNLTSGANLTADVATLTLSNSLTIPSNSALTMKNSSFSGNSITAVNALTLENSTLNLSGSLVANSSTSRISMNDLQGTIYAFTSLRNAETVFGGEMANVIATYQLRLGDASGSYDKFTQNGGVITVRGSSSGKSAPIHIGHWGGGHSIYNLNKGTLNVPNGPIQLGLDGRGTFNQNAGIVNAKTLAVNGSSIYNLNQDAELNLTFAPSGTAGGLKINGGRFVANGIMTLPNVAQFVDGTTSELRANSAVTMNTVNGSGTIVKTGASPLKINGVITSPASFTIAEGELVINDECSLAGNLSISANATLSAVNPFALANGKTLTLFADSIIACDLVIANSTLAVDGGVTTQGNVTFDNATLNVSSLPANQEVVILTAASITGTPTLANTEFDSYVLTKTATQLKVVRTALKAPAPTEFFRTVSGNENWSASAWNNSSAEYKDGLPTILTASANATLNITSAVQPATCEINVPAGIVLTISGADLIPASGVIRKIGAGTLVMNSQSSPVQVEEGILTTGLQSSPTAILAENGTFLLPATATNCVVSGVGCVAMAEGAELNLNVSQINGIQKIKLLGNAKISGTSATLATAIEGDYTLTLNVDSLACSSIIDVRTVVLSGAGTTRFTGKISCDTLIASYTAIATFENAEVNLRTSQTLACNLFGKNTIDVAANAIVTLSKSNSISTGSFVKNGKGRLVLDGTVNMMGLQTVKDGSLELQTANSLRLAGLAVYGGTIVMDDNLILDNLTLYEGASVQMPYTAKITVATSANINKYVAFILDQTGVTDTAATTTLVTSNSRLAVENVSSLTYSIIGNPLFLANFSENENSLILTPESMTPLVWTKTAGQGVWSTSSGHVPWNGLSFTDGSVVHFNQTTSNSVRINGTVKPSLVVIAGGSYTFLNNSNAVWGGDGMVWQTANVATTNNVSMTSSGEIRIDAGSLTLNSIWGENSIWQGVARIADEAKIVLNQSASQILNGQLFGNGTLVKDGSNRLTLHNVQSSFTGKIQLKNGTLAIADENPLPMSQTLELAGGNLELPDGVISIPNLFVTETSRISMKRNSQMNVGSLNVQSPLTFAVTLENTEPQDCILLNVDSSTQLDLTKFSAELNLTLPTESIAVFEQVGNSLVLHILDGSLSWRGSESSIWNTTENNWIINGTSLSAKYSDGARVVLDNFAATIDLNNKTWNPKSISVVAGDWHLANGSVNGSIEISENQKLAFTNATQNLTQAVAGSGQLVAEANAEIRLNPENWLTADAMVSADAQGFITWQADSAIAGILSTSISGNGSQIKTGAGILTQDVASVSIANTKVQGGTLALNGFSGVRARYVKFVCRNRVTTARAKIGPSDIALISHGNKLDLSAAVCTIQTTASNESKYDGTGAGVNLFDGNPMTWYTIMTSKSSFDTTSTYFNYVVDCVFERTFDSYDFLAGPEVASLFRSWQVFISNDNSTWTIVDERDFSSDYAYTQWAAGEWLAADRGENFDLNRADAQGSLVTDCNSQFELSAGTTLDLSGIKGHASLGNISGSAATLVTGNRILSSQNIDVGTLKVAGVEAIELLTDGESVDFDVLTFAENSASAYRNAKLETIVISTNFVGTLPAFDAKLLDNFYVLDLTSRVLSLKKRDLSLAWSPSVANANWWSKSWLARTGDADTIPFYENLPVTIDATQPTVITVNESAWMGNLNVIATQANLTLDGNAVATLNPTNLTINGNLTLNSTIAGKGVRFRYVKFRPLRSPATGSNAGAIALAEFRVYDVDGIVNLASASVSATSSSSGHEPSYLIDGSVATNSKWLAANQNFDTTSIAFVIDLKSLYALTGYSFATADVNGRNPAIWEVYGSQDLENWTLLDSQSYTDSQANAFGTFRWVGPFEWKTVQGSVADNSVLSGSGTISPSLMLGNNVTVATSLNLNDVTFGENNILRFDGTAGTILGINGSPRFDVNTAVLTPHLWTTILNVATSSTNLLTCITENVMLRKNVSQWQAMYRENGSTELTWTGENNAWGEWSDETWTADGGNSSTYFVAGDTALFNTPASVSMNENDNLSVRTGNAAVTLVNPIFDSICSYNLQANSKVLFEENKLSVQTGMLKITQRESVSARYFRMQFYGAVTNKYNSGPLAIGEFKLISNSSQVAFPAATAWSACMVNSSHPVSALTDNQSGGGGNKWMINVSDNMFFEADFGESVTFDDYNWSTTDQRGRNPRSWKVLYRNSLTEPWQVFDIRDYDNETAYSFGTWAKRDGFITNDGTFQQSPEFSIAENSTLDISGCGVIATPAISGRGTLVLGDSAVTVESLNIANIAYAGTTAVFPQLDLSNVENISITAEKLAAVAATAKNEMILGTSSKSTVPTFSATGFSLVLDNSQIILICGDGVAENESLYWKTGTGDWNTTSKNWAVNASTLPRYSYEDNHATFVQVENDVTLTLNQAVKPASLTLNASAEKTLTISGSGSIETSVINASQTEGKVVIEVPVTGETEITAGKDLVLASDCTTTGRLVIATGKNATVTKWNASKLSMSGTGTLTFKGGEPIANFNFGSYNSSNIYIAKRIESVTDGSTVGIFSLNGGKTLRICDDADITVSERFRTSDSNNADIVQHTGGTLSCTGAASGNDKLGAFILGHWGAGSTYNLSGGKLSVPVSIAKIGSDGAGRLNMSGTGIAELHSLRIKTGSVTISENAKMTLGVVAENATAPSAANVLISNSQRFTLSGGTLAFALPTVTAQPFVTTNGVSTIDAMGNSVTLNGVISGNSGVNFASSATDGSISLTAENTYSGVTKISSGTLKPLLATSLGTSVVRLNGGRLELGAVRLQGATLSAESIGSITITMEEGETTADIIPVGEGFTVPASGFAVYATTPAGVYVSRPADFSVVNGMLRYTLSTGSIKTSPGMRLIIK